VILSLNYQPRRIQDVSETAGTRASRSPTFVEPSPLGTGGAISTRPGAYPGTVVVFNGDVMTQISLARCWRLPSRARGKATIVLTPVDNPTEYGLVETDPDGNVRRFLEKAEGGRDHLRPDQRGRLRLEPDTFDRIPATRLLHRARLLPVLERGETFVGVRLAAVLDRHRHAREVHAGARGHHGPALPGEPFGAEARGFTCLGRA